MGKYGLMADQTNGPSFYGRWKFSLYAWIILFHTWWLVGMAPPCFHFRMPYWPHMKQWLQYTERLSFLMSQGTHVCDIALMYPTESMQAYPDASTKMAFEQAMKLSNSGLDYDFMDYRSLQKSKVENGCLNISGEKYRILILADMKAMHYSSLLKIRDFYRSGGIIIATGELPKASTCMGENDSKADAIIREVFGATSLEVSQGKKVKKQVHDSGGVGLYMSEDKVSEQIKSLLFRILYQVPEKGRFYIDMWENVMSIWLWTCLKVQNVFSELRVKLNFGMLLTEQSPIIRLFAKQKKEHGSDWIKSRIIRICLSFQKEHPL